MGAGVNSFTPIMPPPSNKAKAGVMGRMSANFLWTGSVDSETDVNFITQSTTKEPKEVCNKIKFAIIFYNYYLFRK